MKKSLIAVIAVVVIVVIGVLAFIFTRPKERTVSINFAEYGANVTTAWSAEVEGADNPKVQIISTGDDGSIVVITYKNPGTYNLKLTDTNNSSFKYEVTINEGGRTEIRSV